MGTRHYTLHLDKDFEQRLSRIAEENNTSTSEVIRNALATYAFIKGQLREHKDRRVCITGPDGKDGGEIVIP